MYEISKTGSLTYLISLLDKGEESAKYYSCGAILCLMRFDKENVELFAGALNGARNIKNLADLMLAGHDRSKFLSAECLKLLAADPEIVHKLTAVLPQMIEATQLREPRWANMGDVRTICADIIACLAEVEEVPEQFSKRESATSYLPLLRASGAFEAMLPLLHDTEIAAKGHAARVLDALMQNDDDDGKGIEAQQKVLKAEPPPGLKRGAAAVAEASRKLSTSMVNVVGGAARVSVGGGGGGGGALAHVTAAAAVAAAAAAVEGEAGVVERGGEAAAEPGPGSEAAAAAAAASDEGKGVVTAAAACGGGGSSPGYDGLRTLVDISRVGDTLGKSAAAGCIARLCAIGKHVKRELHALGGVAPLVALLTPPVDDAGGKKKKKPAPVPPEVMRGIINAAAALRLLSFEDRIKPDIVSAGAIPGLAKLVEMKGKKWNLNMDAYDAAVGCLYNLAQDRRNTKALEEAELPPHLVRPFPAAWMCDPESGEDEEDDDDDYGEEGDHGGGRRGRRGGKKTLLVGLPGLKPLEAEYGLPMSFFAEEEEGDIRLS